MRRPGRGPRRGPQAGPGRSPSPGAWPPFRGPAGPEGGQGAPRTQAWGASRPPNAASLPGRAWWGHSDSVHAVPISPEGCGFCSPSAFLPAPDQAGLAPPHPGPGTGLGPQAGPGAPQGPLSCWLPCSQLRPSQPLRGHPGPREKSDAEGAPRWRRRGGRGCWGGPGACVRVRPRLTRPPRARTGAGADRGWGVGGPGHEGSTARGFRETSACFRALGFSSGPAGGGGGGSARTRGPGRGPGGCHCGGPIA